MRPRSFDASVALCEGGYSGDDRSRGAACPGGVWSKALDAAVNDTPIKLLSHPAGIPAAPPRGREGAMNRIGRISWRFAPVAMALCAALTTATGQSRRVLSGTVLDSRDRPIAAVNFAVVGGMSAISDDSGRFRLEISHHDRVVFDVRRLGFMPSRIALGGGGDTNLLVLLLPNVQQMAGVEVTGIAKKPSALAGFEERMLARRRAAGSGYFITAKDIESRPATRTTQVVENVPSILVRRTSGDRFGIYGRGVGGAECPATLWLDGVRVGGGSQPTRDRRGRLVNAGETTEIDEYVDPAEIAGVEVYSRGMLAPPQFLPPGDRAAASCAIVVFWTKHGG